MTRMFSTVAEPGTETDQLTFQAGSFPNTKMSFWKLCGTQLPARVESIYFLVYNLFELQFPQLSSQGGLD